MNRMKLFDGAILVLVSLNLTYSVYNNEWALAVIDLLLFIAVLILIYSTYVLRTSPMEIHKEVLNND